MREHGRRHAVELRVFVLPHTYEHDVAVGVDAALVVILVSRATSASFVALLAYMLSHARVTFVAP